MVEWAGWLVGRWVGEYVCVTVCVGVGGWRCKLQGKEGRDVRGVGYILEVGQINSGRVSG